MTHETKGINVLIVGHSNTTPQFENTLLGRTIYPNLDESDYSNMYIITVSENKVTNILLKINLLNYEKN